MKKVLHSYLFWVLVLSAFVASPLIFVGFHQNHDSVTHLARGAQYVMAIKDGQLPPRWAPTSNFGHGSPFFIFYYPLTGYIIALLYLVGFSLENAYLFFSFVTFLIGPLAFYFWTRQLFNKQTAFFAAVVYILLPYRFLTHYVRGGIGEFFAFSLAPFLFLLLELWKKKKNSRYILTAGILFALIVLSHNAVALLVMPIILVYSLMSGKKVFLATFTSVFIGLLLSAYFWIPALVEGKYTQFSFYFGSMFKEHFSTLSNLIYSPWGFGPDINKTGGLSAQIGILAFILVFVAIFFLVKKKFGRERKYVIFWLSIFFAGIFISTQSSEPLWNAISFLKRFQFPWRFTLLPSLAAAALSPYLFVHIKNKTLISIVLFIFGIIALQFLALPNNMRFSDKYYFSYPGSTYYHGEGTTVWTAGDPFAYAKSQIELIGGNAQIRNLKKTSIAHSFTVEATSSAIILDNTIYFPGWTVYVNEKERPIQFQDPEHKGFITFTVDKGLNHVKVVFTETKIRFLSDIISLCSFIVIVVWIFFMLVKKKLIGKKL